ncbi:MAG: dihydrofolate reductase [Candidatus Paceibacterota bacterium]
MISLIAAIGKNNELGKGNDLVWRLPADQKFFRETTTGHPVIMGRKTFDSLGSSDRGEPGKPLPKRRNIVVTRDKSYKRSDVEVVHSLKEALNLFRKKDEEIFIIGGGELFKQAMEVADKLYITHIEAEDKKADVFFPEIIPIVWNEVSHNPFEADTENNLPFVVSIYERF